MSDDGFMNRLISNGPREFKYIYESRIDFVDLYICLNVLLTAIVLVVSSPLENIAVYTNITQHGVTSKTLGSSIFVIGLFNLLRVFSPIKPWCIMAVAMKCTMLMIVSYLLFGILGNPVLPLTTGILFSLCLLSIDNILRTK